MALTQEMTKRNMRNPLDKNADNPNEMTIAGADPADPGPRGVLAKFLKACVTPETRRLHGPCWL